MAPCSAEARVRDYYADGVDMVLYRKDLNATRPYSSPAHDAGELREPSQSPSGKRHD